MKQSITHKSGSSPVSSSSGVHKSIRGAPRGNGNARKRLKWLASYDLTTPEGVQGFLREVVKHTWTGDLGTRQASALNSTCGLLLQYHQDIRELVELRKRAQELEAEYELAKKNFTVLQERAPL